MPGSGAIGTPTTKRTSQRLFRDHPKARFMVSTEAGGEGINLQFCHICTVLNKIIRVQSNFDAVLQSVGVPGDKVAIGGNLFWHEEVGRLARGAWNFCGLLCSRE